VVVCVGCRRHWVEPRSRQHLIGDLLYNALGLVRDISIPLCRDRKLGGEVLSRICARHDGRCCDDALTRDRFGGISVLRASELGGVLDLNGRQDGKWQFATRPIVQIWIFFL
jgi:hypothetical protein